MNTVYMETRQSASTAAAYGRTIDAIGGIAAAVCAARLLRAA
jgi:hypothetical protein